MEMSKQWYVYFAVNLSPSGSPPTPTSMQLGAGDPVVSTSQRISANEVSGGVTITYTYNNEQSRTASEWCDKDTEAEDGVGCPATMAAAIRPFLTRPPTSASGISMRHIRQKITKATENAILRASNGPA
jgi:hypothetical protein